MKKQHPAAPSMFDSPTVATTDTGEEYLRPTEYVAPKDIRTAEQIAKLAAITNFQDGPTGKLKPLPRPTDDELKRYSRPK